MDLIFMSAPFPWLGHYAGPSVVSSDSEDDINGE